MIPHELYLGLCSDSVPNCVYDINCECWQTKISFVYWEREKKLELKKNGFGKKKKTWTYFIYEKVLCVIFLKKVFFLSFFFIFHFFCYLFIFFFSWKLSRIFSLIRRTLNSKRGCCLTSIVQHPLHLQYTHSGMSSLGFRYMHQA